MRFSSPNEESARENSLGWLVGLCLIALIMNFGAILAWALFTAFGSRELPEFVLAMKDLSIVFVVCLILLGSVSRGYVLFNREVQWIMIAVLFVIGANCIQFLTSPADVGSKIVNLRRNVLPLIIVFTFALLPVSLGVIRSYLRFVTAVAIALAIAGFIEYLMPDYFWDRLMNIDEYQRSIELDPYAPVAIGDSGRFYSWDLLTVTGSTVRRMVSGYFEPTTLASFFSFVVIVLVFGGIGMRRRRLCVASIVMAGILTISKAFVVAMVLTLWFSLFPKLRSWIFPAAVAAIFGASMLVVSLNLPGGYFAHLDGFYRGVVRIGQQPFGAGLGLGGNYADLNAATAGDLAAGAESGIGNLIVQIGAFAICYIYIIWRVLIVLQGHYERTREPLFKAAFIALLFWSFTFIVSASSLGLSGNVFFFILSGLMLSSAHVPAERVVRMRLSAAR